MSMELMFAITANAEKKSRFTVNPTTLSIVGLVTTETVAVQIPRVESPDDATDADWTNLVQDGTAVQLDVDNNCIRIPARLNIRLVKAAGVASNAYGVRWA
jgi:hypothetical protein